MSAARPDTGAPVVISLEVRSVTADAAGPVTAGRNIHVRLVGSPGNRAEFTIPNVVEKVNMPEVSPGVYQSHYVVRKGDYTVDAPILAHMSTPDKTVSPAFPAPQHITVDTMPPKLVDQVPADGEHVIGLQPVLYCGFDDDVGTGVDASTVRMHLDGRDVGRRAIVTPLGVTYQPDAPMAPGSHTLFVAAADRAGNAVQNIWHFTVQPPSGGTSQSFTSSPVPTSTLHAGDLLTLTLAAPPSAGARFEVVSLDQTFEMREVQPGRYEGMFRPRAGDSVINAPVVARFSSGGTRYIETLDRPITIDAGPPVRPRMSHPNEIDYYEGTLEFEGKAPPHDRVVCTVTYDSRSQSGIVPFSGTALAVSTRANGRGEWRIERVYPQLRALFADNLDTRLTVRAVTVDAAGNSSEPVSLRLNYQP